MRTPNVTFKVCPACEGHGTARWKSPRRGYRDPCPRCEGAGELTVLEGRYLTPAESTQLAETLLLPPVVSRTRSNVATAEDCRDFDAWLDDMAREHGEGALGPLGEDL